MLTDDLPSGYEMIKTTAKYCKPGDLLCPDLYEIASVDDASQLVCYRFRQGFGAHVVFKYVDKDTSLWRASEELIVLRRVTV
jgi:hypothetical protein